MRRWRAFQNFRLFSGLAVLENLLVAQHNALMKAFGYLNQRDFFSAHGFDHHGRRCLRWRSSISSRSVGDRE